MSRLVQLAARRACRPGRSMGLRRGHRCDWTSLLRFTVLSMALLFAQREASAQCGVEIQVAGKKRCFDPGSGISQWFKDCETCPEMVVVPAGDFLMGADDGNLANKPVHRVSIASPFAVGRFEVTFAEWDACVHE